MPNAVNVEVTSVTAIHHLCIEMTSGVFTNMTIHRTVNAEPILSNITKITTSEEHYQLQEIRKTIIIDTVHENTQKYLQ